MRTFLYNRNSLPRVCLLLALAGMALSGCSITGGGGNVPVDDRSSSAGSGGQPLPSAPAVVPEKAGVLVSPLAQPRQGGWEPLEDNTAAQAPRDYIQPRAGELNPAVVALLNKANRSERNGELEQSAASLERALRIQPDNAWLWHRLALLRLFQHQHDDAVSMASKSNALSGDNARLQADNWRVIAQASGGAFDPTGAPIGRKYGFGPAAISATAPAGLYADVRVVGDRLETSVSRLVRANFQCYSFLPTKHLIQRDRSCLTQFPKKPAR